MIRKRWTLWVSVLLMGLTPMVSLHAAPFFAEPDSDYWVKDNTEALPPLEMGTPEKTRPTPKADTPKPEADYTPEPLPMEAFPLADDEPERLNDTPAVVAAPEANPQPTAKEAAPEPPPTEEPTPLPMPEAEPRSTVVDAVPPAPTPHVETAPVPVKEKVAPAPTTVHEQEDVMETGDPIYVERHENVLSNQPPFEWLLWLMFLAGAVLLSGLIWLLVKLFFGKKAEPEDFGFTPGVNPYTDTQIALQGKVALRAMPEPPKEEA